MALLEGSSQAALRLIVYEDLQCPDTAQFLRWVREELQPRHGDRLAIEHRDFPLTAHPAAKALAEAARVLQEHDPDLALDWREHCLGHTRAYRPETVASGLATWLGQQGVEAAPLVTAFEAGAGREPVAQERGEAESQSVKRTPSVLVGGRSFITRFDNDEVDEAVEEELASA